MDAKIVLNSEILSPSFVPENLAFREKEIALISNQAKNAVNTFIYGPSGSGKTAVMKRVCLESSSTARRVFYMDCSLYQTVNSVLREILSDRLVFSRSNYDLLKKMKERTLQHKATVCLDHFERTKEPEIVTKLVGIGLSIVMSGNNEDDLEELDIRTKSFISSIIAFALIQLTKPHLS